MHDLLRQRVLAIVSQHTDQKTDKLTPAVAWVALFIALAALVLQLR